MIRQVMAVLDRASGTFGTPFFVVSVGAGTRSFRDEVNRKDDTNQLYQHPEDFSLWRLSAFDDNAGEFEQGANIASKVIEASDCFDFDKE